MHVEGPSQNKAKIHVQMYMFTLSIIYIIAKNKLSRSVVSYQHIINYNIIITCTWCMYLSSLITEINCDLKAIQVFYVISTHVLCSTLSVHLTIQ